MNKIACYLKEAKDNVNIMKLRSDYKNRRRNYKNLTVDQFRKEEIKNLKNFDHPIVHSDSSGKWFFYMENGNGSRSWDTKRGAEKWLEQYKKDTIRNIQNGESDWILDAYKEQ